MIVPEHATLGTDIMELIKAAEVARPAVTRYTGGKVKVVDKNGNPVPGIWVQMSWFGGSKSDPRSGFQMQPTGPDGIATMKAMWPEGGLSLSVSGARNSLSRDYSGIIPISGETAKITITEELPSVPGLPLNLPAVSEGTKPRDPVNVAAIQRSWSVMKAAHPNAILYIEWKIPIIGFNDTRSQELTRANWKVYRYPTGYVGLPKQAAEEHVVIAFPGEPIPETSILRPMITTPPPAPVPVIAPGVDDTTMYLLIAGGVAAAAVVAYLLLKK